MNRNRTLGKSRKIALGLFREKVCNGTVVGYGRHWHTSVTDKIGERPWSTVSGSKAVSTQESYLFELPGPLYVSPSHLRWRARWSARGRPAADAWTLLRFPCRGVLRRWRYFVTTEFSSNRVLLLFCHTSYFITNWEIITKDNKVLIYLRGYEIKFSSTSHQNNFPCEPPRSEEENSDI